MRAYSQSSKPAWRDSRLPSLDGLRGAAALVVVVHHSLLTWPALANQYVRPDAESATWWLTFTPLHLVWAGTEAVLVFFVLSGFVLSAAFLRTTGARRWAAYYPARLVRLYLPVWASLVMAVGWVLLFPRQATPDVSWWYAAHAVVPQVGTTVQDAALLGGVTWVHKSLWSLQYEVLFSLALPVYVLLASRRLPWWSTGVLSLALVGLGQFMAWDDLSWLAVFGVGVSMASGRSRIGLVVERWNSGGGGALRWVGVGALAVALLLAEWWGRALGVPAPGLAVVARPAATLGAALLVLAAIGCPSFRRLLSSGPLQWAGRVSFSLYLVHEPIVVSVSSVVGTSRLGVLTTVTVGLGLSVVVAVVFHRCVELPSHRLARWTGSLVRGRAARQAPPVREPETVVGLPRPLPPVPVTRRPRALETAS